jgi:hypothetical protein
MNRNKSQIVQDSGNSPILSALGVRFLAWVGATSLETKTKTYRHGAAFLSIAPITWMKLNCIAGEVVAALRFPASASDANCTLRTL